MKIGIFDSGLGGLIIAKAIRKAMPEYDYVYLGDTKRVPYGNRSHEAVFEFTRESVDYLFRKENCAIVIVACNTASARALRRLQKEYTPSASGISPFAGGEERKILGVLIPAAEECTKFKRIGILGTRGTVDSNTFPVEIKKLRESKPAKGRARIFQNSAPMLVPLAEEGETKNALPFIKEYLQPFLNKKLDAVVLGCTHYPIFKHEIKNQIKVLGKNIKLISQDEIVPKKLKNYLERHQEITKKLTKNKTAKILVTDMTKSVGELTKKWFGQNIKPRLINF
ncbi:glutamate racemase [Candidatus Nomurabacteria bacterium GWB1_40_6]|uniref:Glutamate racemase n=1 Tax=Candidatus Nomurabacteria bacterium GWB1_40_6 TaxID=1801727 RepID=A0A1F6TP56_9BACT|nr:MAG: glutamate racemase [Candidatus Nomurabacteria bacterium GWB1_40_6]